VGAASQECTRRGRLRFVTNELKKQTFEPSTAHVIGNLGFNHH
jgi:hypothetical protein